MEWLLKEVLILAQGKTLPRYIVRIQMAVCALATGEAIEAHKATTMALNPMLDCQRK